MAQHPSPSKGDGSGPGNGNPTTPASASNTLSTTQACHALVIWFRNHGLDMLVAELQQIYFEDAVRSPVECLYRMHAMLENVRPLSASEYYGLWSMRGM
ncbi:hypothetical protein AJ80_06021 [Polytolypa hystricis UAMH7299]|uniref:Uncharacterized protein n=1 Tax=Polytolypa hystricis (strain UAMH7299) TaxID=1447883 RepID=A0A2B7XQW0_POLH7|nr:hypothetical protein AJ80_06021 [Polytolypa hystricis UAMH7299]